MIENTSQHTNSAGVRILPGYIFLPCAALSIAAELRLTLPHIPLPQPASLYAGIIIAVAALLLALSGLKRFLSQKVNPVPYKPAASLVSSGIYRFTRNPMYVGFVGMLAGATVALGSLPFMASTVVMFVFLNSYAIPREEAYLTRTFGEDYKNYCRRVRRWL